MAASFTIAARNNGFTKADARAATLASVRAYREAMAEFAEMRTMDIWYAHLSEQDLMDAMTAITGSLKGAERKQAQAAEKNAQKSADEGAHPRQPAGAVEAGRAGRRPVPDRQPAAGRHPGTRAGADDRHVRRRGRAHDPRAVPRVPGDAAGRPPSPARAVPGGRRGPQGRRGRQRRHPRVHRAAAGPRPTGPAVPAGQGSDEVGAGGPPAEESLPPARRARRAGPADDAGRERHLPRLDQGRRGRIATCTGGSSAT